MSLHKQVSSLVRGHVSWADLCRFAAHNLAERNNLYVGLEVRGICPVRKRYMQQQLGVLELERTILLEKKDRIEGKVPKSELESFKFII